MVNDKCAWWCCEASCVFIGEFLLVVALWEREYPFITTMTIKRSIDSSPLVTVIQSVDARALNFRFFPAVDVRCGAVVVVVWQPAGGAPYSYSHPSVSCHDCQNNRRCKHQKCKEAGQDLSITCTLWKHTHTHIHTLLPFLNISVLLLAGGWNWSD